MAKPIQRPRRSVPKPAPNVAGASRLVPQPKQQRGHATQQALINAFWRLMSAQSFSEISVNDIVKEARSSIGSFYSRFASKEALLVPLIHAMTHDAATLLDRATTGDDLRAVLRAYAGTFVAWFSANRRALQAVTEVARGEAASEINAMFLTFNREAHRRLREALAPFASEIRAPNPKSAIEFGMFFASSAARDGVRSSMWATYDVRPTNEELTTEIVEAWYAYLAGPQSRRAGPTRAARRPG